MPLIIGQGGSDAGGGDSNYSWVNLLQGATASIDNKISSAVSDILPGFVSNNHQGFVDFMEAYYEWMEQVENPHGTSVTLIDLMDVDKTFESFIEYFKDIYLKDFPKNLAVDSSGNELDEKIIIKNINDFYSSKGTEKSYKLFLRMLYDSDVEFYYPKEDMLRVSDGKWIQKKSIKVTSENRTRNFDLVKTTIEQVNRESGDEVTASATVESILQYKIGQYFVTEMFLADINGTFLQGKKIKGYDSDGNVLYEDIYSVPSVVEIISMGAGYRAGDGAIIDENSSAYLTGKGSDIEVDVVDRDGGIEQVIIKNHGVNYTSSTTDDKIPLIFRSTSGDGNAQGNILLSALCIYPGYWLDNDGKLSSNKFMRDNVRFHEFSYVLKTETAIDDYREQARKLIHPAGTRLFGDISLLNIVSSAIPYHTEIVRMEPPLVGHYTPYTLNTHDNLRGATGNPAIPIHDLYPEGYNPSSTGANQCLGNTGGRIAIGCTFAEGVIGYTLGSFVNGQTFEQKHTGVTGMIFEWNRTSNTGGVLFVYTEASNGGTALGFTDGGFSFSCEDAGLTGTITDVKVGNGTVWERSSSTHHATGPAGALGEGGADGADVFGLTYWGINSSFQSSSDDISEVINSRTLKITSPYTAGYDYSIGNLVHQECSPGVKVQGIVVGWDPGVSGEVGDHDQKIGRLTVQETSGVFGQGGDCAINEIDNHTGNISVSYLFSDATTTSTEFRIKVKNIYLDDVVLIPTSGAGEYIFHSGDDEAGVVGGYTGAMANP